MIDWHSRENYSFLNTKFSNRETEDLLQLVSRFDSHFKGHIFLLSSGTTASSAEDLKWVALRKSSFLASAESVNRHLSSNSADVWLHTLPDFHVGGLGIWARSHLSGARVIKIEGWKIQHFLEQVSSHRVTLTSLVPAQIYDLVKENRSCPPSMRAVLVGGGALSRAVYLSAVRLGWPLLPSYGMTEACTQIATAPLDSSRGRLSEMSGLPSLQILPHVEVSACGDQRIKIKGDCLFTSYIFRNSGNPVLLDPKESGWFMSQDRGQVIGDHLEILGRTGDFVKVGGESVSLARLTDILDAVRMELGVHADSVLLAIPDERLGHVIYLISNHQLSAEKAALLAQHFNAKVLGFEKIRKWIKLKNIPRTSLGKLIPSQCLDLALQMGRQNGLGL